MGGTVGGARSCELGQPRGELERLGPGHGGGGLDFVSQFTDTHTTNCIYFTDTIR